MSRIGKRPVAIPSGVTAAIDNGTLNVKGPKGTLSMGLSDLVSYNLDDGSISVAPANDSKASRSHWGMQRTLVSNLVEGVTAVASRRPWTSPASAIVPTRRATSSSYSSATATTSTSTCRKASR